MSYTIEKLADIRKASDDAWENIDVELELAALRGKPSGIEAMVCQDIFDRQQIGIEKYQTTVARNDLPLREWLNHAYQECLDQAIYLRKAIDDIDQSAETKPG